MANNEPKKGGILRAYLNVNVLYKILIGLVIGAVAGIILAAKGVTALPAWISMFGTIFTRLLKMIIIPIIVGSLVVWQLVSQHTRSGEFIIFVSRFRSFIARGSSAFHFLCSSTFLSHAEIIGSNTTFIPRR